MKSIKSTVQQKDDDSLITKVKRDTFFDVLVVAWYGGHNIPPMVKGSALLRLESSLRSV